MNWNHVNAMCKFSETSGKTNQVGEEEVMRRILEALGFIQPVQIIGKNEAVRRLLALSASEEMRKLRAIAETLERVR